MKKIAVVLACIVLFCTACVVCWWYFENNMKDYLPMAEYEISDSSKVYYLKNSFLEESELGIKLNTIDEDGSFRELYSENGAGKSVVFCSEEYFVLSNSAGINAYDMNDELKKAFDAPGTFESAHVFADSLYVKMIDAAGNTVIYLYDSVGGVRNLTQEYSRINFVDYCFDSVTRNEFFISYVLSGEYVKLVISIYDSGVKVKTLELDNLVYNGFDYIDGMFVFYTDTGMIFINSRIFAKREQHVYDVDALTRFIYGDKIVYLMDDAFFDGVNDMFYVTPDSSGNANMTDKECITKFGDKMIYYSDKYVRSYSFGGALLDDPVLFTEEGVMELGVMGDIIAARKMGKIIFMKAE